MNNHCGHFSNATGHYAIDKQQKAIPVHVWTGPEGSRRLRPPISRQSTHKGGKVVSPTHRPPLAPRKYSWCSFLLQSESILGP
jgi:hypothetical protein